jgi:hypothetical protein
MKKITKIVATIGFLTFILLMPTINAIVGAAEIGIPPEGRTSFVSDVTPASGDMKYYTVTPCRILDTRSGSPISAGSTINFKVAGLCGVPYPAAKAVMVNIAATNTTGPGHLRAFAWGTSTPFAAVLNYGTISGLNAISNASIIPICESSCTWDMSIYSSSTTDVVVDVMGYFGL